MATSPSGSYGRRTASATPTSPHMATSPMRIAWSQVPSPLPWASASDVAAQAHAAATATASESVATRRPGDGEVRAALAALVDTGASIVVVTLSLPSGIWALEDIERMSGAGGPSGSPANRRGGRLSVHGCGRPLTPPAGLRRATPR